MADNMMNNPHQGNSARRDVMLVWKPGTGLTLEVVVVELIR